MALVQSKKAVVNGQDSTTLTFNSTPAAGNMIAVAVATYGATTSMTVSDNKGNGNYSQACFEQLGANAEGVWLYYKENIASSATFTITVNPGGASADITLVIMEFDNISTTSPLDQANSTGTGDSTTPTSGNITTTQDNETLIGVLIHGNSNRALGYGAGWTGVDENEGGTTNMPISVEYRIANIGTYAATFSITGSSSYDAVIASFKAPAAGQPAGRRGEFVPGMRRPIRGL